jgi:hypothetical protein
MNMEMGIEMELEVGHVVNWVYSPYMVKRSTAAHRLILGPIRTAHIIALALRLVKIIQTPKDLRGRSRPPWRRCLLLSLSILYRRLQLWIGDFLHR